MPTPSTVYLIVDTPDQSRSIQERQPPTTMGCWAFPLEKTIEDTVRKHASKFPLGSTVRATTDARVDTWHIGVSLEPSTPPMTDGPKR